jgi:hypothetical protein
MLLYLCFHLKADMASALSHRFLRQIAYIFVFSNLRQFDTSQFAPDASLSFQDPARQETGGYNAISAKSCID